MAMTITDFLSISVRIIFSSAVFLFFVFTPLKSRYRHSRLKTLLLLSSIIVISIAVTMALFATGDICPQYNIIPIAFWIAYAAAIFRAVIRGSSFEGIFIVLVVLNLYANIITIAKLIAKMADWSIPPLIARAVIAAGILIIYLPLLWILMFKLYKPIIDTQIEFSGWRFIWIVPALTYIIFYVKIIRDYWNEPVQPTAGDVVFNILWSLSSYIFFCVLLLLLIQTSERNMALEQTRLVTVQLKMQEEQYEQLLNNIEESARVRHDWRHHLLTINGLAKEQKMNELNEYLAKLMPVCLNEGELPVCEKHVVNIILQHYSAMAKAEGIDINISADIPRSLDIPDIDFCIIFGNLLENAIEACISQEGDHRFINIKTAVKEKILVIMIRNTYEKELIVKNNIYYSTKHEGAGIGLPSVRRVVEKNKGYMQLKHDNGYFSVDIILNASLQGS